jgi:hypothetical protein
MESENPIFREQLKTAMDATVTLWNTICEIDPNFLHKMDRQEFCTDIHNIQNRIYSIAYKNMEFFD